MSRLAMLGYAPYCLLFWRTHGAYVMVLDSGLSPLFALTGATNLFRRSLNRSRDPHHRIFWDPSLVPITSRRRPHSADPDCTTHGHVSKSHIHTNGNHTSASSISEKHSTQRLTQTPKRRSLLPQQPATIPPPPPHPFARITKAPRSMHVHDGPTQKNITGLPIQAA